MVSEKQYETLEILNVVTALISLLAVITVLVSIITFGIFRHSKKDKNNHNHNIDKINLEIKKSKIFSSFQSISFSKLSFYMIAFIFLSDIFRIIGHLLPSPEAVDDDIGNNDIPTTYTEITCSPGAFFKLFGSLSTFIWIIITAFILYKLLLYPHKFDKSYVQKIKRIFHVVSWPIALLISVIPLIAHEYTNERDDGPWCFIPTNDSKGMLLAFFCYYLWLILTWFLIIIIYITIGKLLFEDHKKTEKLNKDSMNQTKKIITKVPTIQRLQYYPFIFIFCWFWEILSIGYNKLSDSDIYNLRILQIIFTNFYGLFNSILFYYVIYNYSGGFNINLYLKSKHKLKHNKTKNSHTTTHNHITVTDNTTTTNKLHIPHHNHTNIHDFSGDPTVSLNVGNVSVLSPTSVDSDDKGDLHDIPLNAVSIDDDNDNDDGYISTDDDYVHLNKKTITIGYNEDESDDYYSDYGNIAITNDDDDDNGILSDSDNNNQDDDCNNITDNNNATTNHDEIEHAINDEYDGYK